MSSNIKYFALVLELPAFMLVLGYLFEWLDGSFSIFGGQGMISGLMLAVVIWIWHASLLMKSTNNDQAN